MPRPSKLTPDLQVKIIERLATGSTIKTTCDSVGIGERTYYQWVEIGNAFLNDEEHARMPRKVADREFFAQFAQATTRAIASGMITAADCFHNGMLPTESESVMTETIEETRINPKTGEEYTYRKTLTRRTITTMPGDWRAAMEYLSRRDPENWARVNKNEVTGKDGKPIQTTQTNVNVPAENAHDASSILKQLAELGAIPSEPGTANHHTETD